MKTYKIAVAGTGYVGLSLSVLLAQHNQVMAVDIVQAKVDMINNHKYLRWQEQKNHSKVASVDFRNNRDFGWHDHVETLYFENGKSTSSRIFKELFYGHTVLRPSCYGCPYKSMIGSAESWHG